MKYILLITTTSLSLSIIYKIIYMGFHLIHQFPSPIPVHTPHGEGQAILVIDYGLNVNTVFLVRLSGGKIKHYYSDDIRIYGNPMDNLGWDIDIPNDWSQ